MLHRSLFDEIGRFDETIRYAQDWDLWNRIGICHLWASVPEVLTTRREFGNLTAKIEADADLRARRDLEDGHVRGRYTNYLPAHMKKMV
jgi:hypothetical protein